MRTRIPMVLALLLLGSLLGGGGFAIAKNAFTSKDIKDGSIENRDIHKGVISLSRLTKGVQDRINTGGAPGAQGAPGAPGAPGPPGAPGAPGGSTVLTSGNWGLVDRNIIGSPVAQLRHGPGDPPQGVGSLNLLVGSGTEKIAYGITLSSKVPFSKVTALSYWVYTTGENNDHGQANMPSVQFEIDPNISAAPTTHYSTLGYVPAKNSVPNVWEKVDATKTGLWFLTRAAGTATGCDPNGSLCSWDTIKEKLNDGGDDAQILTVSITKGRDLEWQGAVDALQVNSRIADFEESSVVIKDA